VPLAFSTVVFLAFAAILAYLADWCGLPVAPFAVLPVSAIAGAGTFVGLRGAAKTVWPPVGPIVPSVQGDGRRTASLETMIFLGIASASLAWLLWLARPSLLPPGSGPDLTHHLALIDYIEVHGRLPHDPQLAAALGEMVNYTPGSHLLAALAGAWARTDGLHAIYTLVALTVAIKTGLIFLIARRMMPSALPRAALALTAVLLLFRPSAYFLGSFTAASYLAQVVAEMFAVAMWLAVVLWMEQPSTLSSVLIGLCGTATFLAWPVALGPVLLLAVIVMACRFDRTVIERVCHLAVATIPIALVSLFHTLGRTGAVAIVAVAGYVAYPRFDLFGWGFLVAAAIGLMTSVVDRRSRTVTLLFITIALQAAALLFVARRAGAARPYMALKMVYLGIYPMAVAGSVAFARLLQLVERGVDWIGRTATSGGKGKMGGAESPSCVWGPSGVSSPSGAFLPGASLIAWALVLGLGFSAVRSAIHMPRPKPAVSQPLFVAGEWARTNLKPECVDYVVNDVFSAYWLHIAVLRNARAAPRSMDDDTYQPEKELIRWVEPDGLPYAIAQDFDQLPRDVRTHVDVVARFGPAAIIKRRGRSICGG
jgi:hypothetical protein